MRRTQLRYRCHLAHTRTEATTRARLDTLVAGTDVYLGWVTRVARLLIAVVHVATARRVRTVVVRTQVAVVAVLRSGVHTATRLATRTARIRDVVRIAGARRCLTHHARALRRPRRLTRRWITDEAAIIARTAPAVARTQARRRRATIRIARAAQGRVDETRARVHRALARTITRAARAPRYAVIRLLS